MKNTILSLIILIASLGALDAQTSLPQPGQTFLINGQSFEISTNSLGQFVLTTAGPAGSETFTPATTPQGAVQQAQNWMQENNPTNADFYGTNEYSARCAAIYLQNSGQAVAEIGLQKWCLIHNIPIGIEGDIYQGNNGGASGTAGAGAMIETRRVIGNVAGGAGIGAGYDAWNKAAMVDGKLWMEYRQSAHLGEFVSVGYALEPFGSAHADRGLMAGGGLSYNF